MKTHLFKQALEAKQKDYDRNRIVNRIIDGICLAFLAFCLLGLMTGCTERNDPKIVQQNNYRFQGPGEYVGTMGDGIRVYRWEIEMGPHHQNHFIYRLFPKKKEVKAPVEPDQPDLPDFPDHPEKEWPEGFLNSTTLNYSEQHGKTTVNRTLVFAE